MEDRIDPYLKWLDIPPGRRPPDHYALLGLERRSADPATIARAADVRLAKVRKIRPGGHLADWGRLLDQLNAAKTCLLDPASRTAYDASLASESLPAPAAPHEWVGGNSDPPAAAPLPVTQTAPDAEPDFSKFDRSVPYRAGGAAADRPARKRGSSAGGPAVAALVLLLAGLGGAFYYVINRNPEVVDVNRPDHNAPERERSATPPEMPAAGPSQLRSRRIRC